MNVLRRYWLTFALLGATLAAPAVVFERLPDSIPMHWNAAGEIDGWAPKWPAAFAMPAVWAISIGLMLVVPALSPGGYSMQPFARIYPRLTALFAAFGLYLTITMLRAAFGVEIRIDQHVLVAIGLLLAGLGNYFGKLTRNFFVGIRTPWTLANPEVWERTHRFSGAVAVVGGLFVAGCGLVGGVHVALPLAAVLAVAILPIVYSYATWRRLEPRG